VDEDFLIDTVSNDIPSINNSAEVHKPLPLSDMLVDLHETEIKPETSGLVENQEFGNNSQGSDGSFLTSSNAKIDLPLLNLDETETF
jgi:hypothetical protein